jgi:hypothetical protein
MSIRQEHSIQEIASGDGRAPRKHCPLGVMVALLAICRKVIILDLKETDASQTFALAAAILALGLVYWLIRDSDQRLVGGA